MNDNINMGEHLFAWVTEEPGGSVSLVGAWIPEAGGNLPLIGRSRDAIMKLRPVALHHGRASGQRVWMREYIKTKDHEDLA